MRLKKRGIPGASLLVALPVAALVIAPRIRESEARAPGAAVGAVRPAPEPADSTSGDAAENSSEIIGVIEPLLVGSPSPDRDHPGRSARR